MDEFTDVLARLGVVAAERDAARADAEQGWALAARLAEVLDHATNYPQPEHVFNFAKEIRAEYLAAREGR